MWTDQISPGYQSLLKHAAAPVADDASMRTDQINQGYQTLFGVDADPDSMSYWTDQLNTGNVNSNNLLSTMTTTAGDYGYVLNPSSGFYESGYTAPVADNASMWTDAGDYESGYTAPVADDASMRTDQINQGYQTLFEHARNPGSSSYESGYTAPVANKAGASSDFDFPLDLYQSSSESSSTDSYSGLPPEYQSQLLSSIIPSLLESVENVPGDIDQYTQEAMKAYGSTFSNMVEKAVPSLLNEIYGRNMQDSSIAGDVTANVISDLSASLQPQAYGTAMQAAKMKTETPGLLAGIAGLGDFTQSSNVSQAESSDPGQPYETMLTFLQRMMGF